MGKMSKEKAGAATAGPSKQYMARGGKVGNMTNPNAKATVKPSKKMGGMYKSGGMKKGK